MREFRIRRLLQTIVIAALAVAATGALPAAQPARSHDPEPEVSELLARLEKDVDRFQHSLAGAPDREWTVGVASRSIDPFVTGFVEATRRLRTHFDEGRLVTTQVEEVLRRGVSIDSFMDHHPTASQAARDWAAVRRDLESLAAAFHVPWNVASPRITTLAPDASSPVEPRRRAHNG